MPTRRATTLLGLAIPLTLMQVTPISCPSGGEGGGPLFNLPPTVVLTSDVQRGIAPLTVRFSSSASSDDGVIVRRLWDFGDGVGTSEEISPTYIYTATGTYTVRLTLTDDQGAEASATTQIFVTQRPVAVIEVDRTWAETAPAVFNFDGSASYDPDAQEGEELLYEWDFGDGTRELLATVPHTFATAGSYRVRLTVTDAVGVTGFAEKIIEVGIPRPRISFRSPPPEVTNIVCTNAEDAVLWVHAVYDVEPGVPRMVRAGLDSDRDPCNAQVAVYDPQTGIVGQRLVDPTTDLALQQGPVRAAVFSPRPGDLRVLAGGDDGYVRLYDAVSGALLRRHSSVGSPVRSLAFSPDGEHFAVAYANGAVALRGTVSGTVVRTLVGHAAAVNAVAFSPDGSQILSGDQAGIAILWDAADGAEVLRYDHGEAAVSAVAFSPVDPRRVLTGSEDGTARLWSTVSGELLQEFGPVFSGQTLVAGHADAITSVAFSQDGTLVLTGSADQTAILWSASLGSQLRTFTGHSGTVRSVAFSPDGTQVITGGDDRTARIWNADTAELIRTLQPCLSPITAVGYSPDGQAVLAAVAAQNDIQLDTDPPSGGDLNLTMPTALRLRDVPSAPEGRRYYLWVEVQTDRTAPVRSYARLEREGADPIYTHVRVLPAFTETIEDATPTIPLRSRLDPDSGEVLWEEAAVLVPGTTGRHIFDLGALNAGDRLYLSLLSTPGYGELYSSDRPFSVMVLDAEQEVFAWYQESYILFTRDVKLIIGHDSPRYFVVVDGCAPPACSQSTLAQSISVRVVRDVGLTPRQQHIYVNFEGGQDIVAGGIGPMDIPPFNAGDLNPAWEDTEAFSYTQALKDAIVARIQALYDPWNIVVTTSDEEPPDHPFQTVYIDSYNIEPYIVEGGVLLGSAAYIDPRNETLTGNAAIAAQVISLLYPDLSLEELGLTIGNVATHESGHLLGLRHTWNPADVMSYAASDTDPSIEFTSSPLWEVEQYNSPGIGIQDAPQLLGEVVGAKP